MIESKYTMDTLRQRQALPLDAKIEFTKLRIKWWLDKFPSYISFSGGKDSTVLLHIARQVSRDIPAVFVDTGLEYPEIRGFALSQENVTRLRPEMNFRKVIETYGYPLISKEVAEKIYIARRHPDGKTAQKFLPDNEYDLKYGKNYSMVKWNSLKESDIPISHMCCEIMKKRPAKQYEKETGRKAILGTMACESRLRQNAWLQNGCNAYDSPRPISRPMSIWTEQDVLQYIYENKLPYAAVYGDIIRDKNGKFSTTGCSRTGCVFCAFGCHLEKEPNRFQTLKLTHPKLWEYCMKDFSGGGLGMKSVLDYIGVKTE